MIIRCLLLSAVVYVGESTVKCFCDRSSCQESLVCQGDYCIIGLRKDAAEPSETGKLRQMCGQGEPDRLERCDQTAPGWQEVCQCKEDFCNTFAFLRSSIDSHPDQQDAPLFTQNRNRDNIYPIHRTEGAARAHRSSLIVLLVIIPLSVGGLAVCLIFLNYHCKMC